MLLNVSLSKAHRILSDFALIDAALGALYSKASSPKASPGLYVLRYLSPSSFFLF
jgi:hypothetical protein